MLKSSMYLRLVLLVVGILIVSTSAAVERADQDFQIDAAYAKNKIHPKIESNLLKEKSGAFAAQIQSESTIQVVFELKDSDKSYIRSLEDNGAVVEAVHKNLVQASVPASKLKVMSEMPFVDYVRSPMRPYKDGVVSEGVGVINASKLHSLGFDGSGVKIAVLDLGFANYSSKLGIELPDIVTVRSFSRNGIEADGDIHGTAVAEIVYDIAPNASMYFINFDTDINFSAAVDYAISQDVDVISMSAGFLPGPFNGTGFIDDIVNNATSQGIIWVNSAGNFAQEHWEGGYTQTTITVDSETWNVHDFGTGDPTNSFYADDGDTIVAILSWNDWPRSNQDYDLFLANEDTGNLVNYSVNVQNGTQEPSETIVYLVTESGEYGIIIRKFDATVPVDFELYFMSGHSPEYKVMASSLGLPADARDVITVGATHWSNDVLEYFSSQGPTNDGRTKPDLVAPDGVSTSTYGIGDFYGTSASAPHVAGAAALLLSANHSLTSAQVNAALESGAKDIGAAGKDNETGAGRVDVYNAYQHIPVSSRTITVDDSGGADYTRIQDAINNASDGDTILVYSGIYYEHVVVNKQLILRGIDNGNGKPVVNADHRCVNGRCSAINLSAGNSTIEGFIATGSSGGSPDTGGIVLNSNNNIISGNNISDNVNYGIWLNSSSNNTLSGNIANSNLNSGIYMDSSSSNTLSGNTASNNRKGIQLRSSSNNNLSGNIANSNFEYGIRMDFASNHNLLTGNTVNSNQDTGIIFLNSSDNTLNGNFVSNNINFGIELAGGCTNNTLSSNNASNNGNGIVLSFSNNNNNTLSGNTANSNLDAGIFLSAGTYGGSSNNILSGNIASNNSIGISLASSSSNNKIYNNFLSNIKNVEVYANNIWNLTKTAGENIIHGPYLGGNVWANPSGTGFSQTCTDVDADGICDSSYVLDSKNIDYLPLVQPGNIKGIVTNTTGVPIAGAIVSGGGVSNTTDARGNYTLTNIAPGLVQVTATKTGFAPNTSSVMVVSGATVTLDVMLREVPGKVRSVVTNTTAFITWVTNNLSDSMVKYGLSPGNYTFIKYINESVIFHNVILTNLSPDTNYYFVANSTDMTGSTQSQEITFWTPYDNFQGNLNITNIEIRQLTDYEERASSPVWSEDKIFYASNISGNMDVWMVDKDGSNKTRITNSTADEYPSDSWVTLENNSKVYNVLHVSRTNGNSSIWVTNGTNKVQLIDDSYENLDPVLIFVPAPVVFGMLPSGTINDNVPLINASYYSYYGNISKVNISVDGIDVTQFTNISLSNLSHTPAEPLKMGFHNFTITVETDKYTKGFGHQFFNIRYIYNPSPLCAVFTGTPTISANISVGYGNISSVVMTLDEKNVTSSAIIYPSYIEYTPIVPLKNGSHNVSIEVKSTRNFSDTENWTFYVNSSTTCTTASGSGGGGGGGYRKILFASNRSGNFDLWMMNLNGSVQEQITYDPSNESSPAWVESKVVFVSDKSGSKDIWSMDINGSNKKRLTSSILDENMPSWSYIGGIMYTAGKDGVFNLEAMNTNGTGKIKITNSSAATEPAYSSKAGFLNSPWNTGILYGSATKGERSIYLMNFEEIGPNVKFWKLGEGYSLQVAGIDIKASPAQAWFELQRNGTARDNRVVRVGEAFSLFDNQKVILNAVLDRVSSSDLDYYFEVELVNVTQYSSIDDSPLFTNATKILVISKIILTEPLVSLSGIDKTPSSGGGGGGGGGGASGENYSNIELREKYDEAIYKDKPTSYKFKNASNPIMFVNITGNVNAGLITTMAEVLKGTSTLVKEAAPGDVYKNVNIWVGTSGFSTSKNIKEATVMFRVENSWIDNNALLRSEIKLVKWDNGTWKILETSEKNRDGTYSYFEGKTTSFSPFAVTGIKEAAPTATLPGVTAPADTTTAVPLEAAQPGNLAIILVVIVLIAVIGMGVAVYMKRK